MNKLALAPIATVIAAATLVSTPALADHEYRYAGDRRDRWEEPRPAYDGRRGERYEYAEVVSATPIYRSVRIEEPRRECWDEQVVYDEGPRYRNPGAGGAILGAILGGVAGHQFGSGRGNDAATAGGAVVGGLAGHEAEKRMRATSYYKVGVNMENGTFQTINVSDASGISAGSKVRIVNGNLQLR